MSTAPRIKRFAIATFATLGIFVLSAQTAGAQGWDDYEGGAGFTLGENDDKFIRFITWAQIWARAMEMNPGTEVSGSTNDWQTDIGLRRVRFLVYAKPRDNLLVLLHLGINNQSFRSREADTTTPRSVNPFAFVHGAWVEQTFFDGALSIGSGLHYWWGISRLTNASTLNFLALDSPIFSWPLIQLSDQFARQLGVYAKGKIAKLDYRVSVNRPFSVAGDLESIEGGEGAVYNPNANSWSTGGYFDWEFWDQESNTLPYKVGSYLGTKSVLNLGAGFYYHPEAMVRRTLDGEIDEQDQTIFAIDAFLDTPLPNDAGAITVYGGFFNYDLGDDHLRNVGIMNIGSVAGDGSQLSVNGPGNAYPTIGTGNTYYLQAGYLLPFKLTEEEHRIMPFVATQVSDFDALDDLMGVYEAGFNYYLAGHHAKYTLQYRNRPIFTLDADGAAQSSSRASEVIAQAHFWF